VRHVALVRPHGQNAIYEVDAGAKAFPKNGLTQQVVANGLTVNITYEDMGVGFTDPLTGAVVRDRFADVLVYVAGVINTPNRTLDIQVTPSEFDGTGALASAGTFFPVIAGIHPGSTLRRLSTGFKPFAGFPEISVSVDLGFPWNFDESDPPPGTADFFSVLLHEITHGLGFTSLIEPDGSSSVGPGVYSVYDSLLTDGTESSPLLSGGIPPAFQAGIASLIGDDVWFDGGQAFVRYDRGTPVPVYAPAPYEPGSSISHWDLNTIQSVSVMTHAITLGTAQREFAPVDLGALIDLGYNGIDGAPDAGFPGCNPGGAQQALARPAGGDWALMGIAGAVLLGGRRRRNAGPPEKS